VLIFACASSACGEDIMWSDTFKQLVWATTGHAWRSVHTFDEAFSTVASSDKHYVSSVARVLQLSSFFSLLELRANR